MKFKIGDRVIVENIPHESFTHDSIGEEIAKNLLCSVGTVAGASNTTGASVIYFSNGDMWGILNSCLTIIYRRKDV